MKITFKIIAFIYLFLITISLLIPIDIYLFEENIKIKQQPTRNEAYIIHLVLFFQVVLVLYLNLACAYLH